MNAVIYARYSSHNQREESIEGQLRECHDYAAQNGFQVIHEYIDRAISGKTDNRPDFQKLIRDSEKHHFEAVIMYTLDRFARNRYDSAIYKSKLKKNGVRVLYAKQPMPDTPEGIILESVLEGYAEYYSENLSRNIKRGLRENVLRGIYSGNVPFGYVLGENRKLCLDPLTSKAVIEIFNRYSAGDSMISIVKWLNEKGYKTSRGNSFNKNSLKRILSNEKYIGIYKVNDLTVENAVPPIIDNTVFEKAQAMMKHNLKTKSGGKSKLDYLLTGKLFCGHCGSPMIGESGTSKSGALHSYYKCACRKRLKTCSKKTERKDQIEQIIVQNTVQRLLVDDVINNIAEAAVRLIQEEYNDTSLLSALQKSLTDTVLKIKNIMLAIEQGIITSTTKERLEQLEQEKLEIENRIAYEKMEKPFLTKDHIVFWLSSFKNGNINDISYQRKIIDTLINAVFIYDSGDKGREIVFTFNTSSDNSITIKCSDIGELSPPNEPQNSSCIGCCFFEFSNIFQYPALHLKIVFGSLSTIRAEENHSKK